MTKVLVTGYRGLLGATLMRSLPLLGLKARAIESDVRDGPALEDEVAIHNLDRKDWVVHCAAMTNTAECEKNPLKAEMVNAFGCDNLVGAVKDTQANIIYISTVSVFPGVKGDYKETDNPFPVRVYDQTKFKGEKFIREYEHGMVLRLNLIGLHPDEIREKNFLEWLTVSLVNNQDIKLYQDIVINPLSAQTASALIGEIIQKKIRVPVLHIGSKDKMSKAGIGLLVKERIPNYEGNIAVGNAPNGSPKEMWLNTDLAQSLGLVMPSVKDEIARVLG